jgi:hypothetical protein
MCEALAALVKTGSGGEATLWKQKQVKKEKCNKLTSEQI